MATKLINNSQIKSAIHGKGIFGDIAARALMSILGLNRINRIYAPIGDYMGVDFADKLLERLNITVDFNESELANIPTDKPFIITSNHPFGAVDGVIMLSLIGKIRPDIKILTNFILSYIPNLTDNFLPVNPFSNSSVYSSIKGIQMAVQHLKDGGCLGLFPAGEVSSNKNDEHVVKDPLWQPSIIKLIKRSGVPVVPIYFDGQNSNLFHILGKVHPMLRTIRLPHELSNKKNKTISVRFGTPIPITEISECPNLESLGNYLRNRTYALEGNIDRNSDKQQHVTYTTKVAESAGLEAIEAELKSIEHCKLFKVYNYSGYLVDYSDIPVLMREIAIRREIAFRAVGEGTGTPMDTDKYDTYYKHLFLWDEEKHTIIGAYRLGFGREIIQKYGLAGLYSDSLFRYKRDFITQLVRAIELGRSFVSVEYQKDALALMLLLKGLLLTVIKYPEIKYLVGPVSISSWYPKFYRSIMIYYLRKMHSAEQFASSMDPKTPFVPDYLRVNPEHLLVTKSSSLEKFDRFLSRSSNGKYRLPTLLKKYLKINCRIIEYNVDPDFNYCVDGLILLDTNDLPKSEIDTLLKDYPDKEAIYKRFDISVNEMEQFS